MGGSFGSVRVSLLKGHCSDKGNTMEGGEGQGGAEIQPEGAGVSAGAGLSGREASGRL